MDFELHPKLAADCFHVCDLPVCTLLLMNDARYPWCILVPRAPGARELHALAPALGHQVWTEVMQVAAALEALTRALKMNVAALGNQVAQLHVHVIARNATDAAWPGPVWGVGQPTPYTSDAREAALRELRDRFEPAGR